MKTEDIKVGKTYKGKNGRTRRVISEGGRLHPNQMDTDVITYVGVSHLTDSGNKGKAMTRKAFASWAAEALP